MSTRDSTRSRGKATARTWSRSALRRMVAFLIRLRYTNNGNLIGNTVGRGGRSIQCWFNYWIAARHTLQFTYKHNTVSPNFVPQGGAWQDYGLRHELHLRSGFYWKSQLQYEHISRYPLLFSHSQSNTTAVVELGFVPLH